MQKSQKSAVTFTARLVEAMYGNFSYASAILPKKIADGLPAGRQRTKGTLNNIPFSLAIQYRKDGQRFFCLAALCAAPREFKSAIPWRLCLAL